MFARRPLLKLVAFAVVVACGQSAQDLASEESALLPNSAVFETGHDGAVYKAVADFFRNEGRDMRVNLDGFAPQWPLRGTTTTVLNRLGTPVLYSGFGYYHTAMDVMRSDPTASADVLAPHGGRAVVFDWNGRPLTTVTNPYNTLVAIYDPVSHVVTPLMHVKPEAALLRGPTEVQRGAVIGKLASAPLSSHTHAARLSHVHVNFIDGENLLILNPVRFFSAYKDATPPTPKGIYVTDENAKVRPDFYSGKFDLVLEAFDKDDESAGQFEVSEIAFSVTDQAGNTVASQPRCQLDHLYESIREQSSFRARELIDFGSASAQITGAWPSSDIDNAARKFRYALTQLEVVDGTCRVKDDADGYLEVPAEVTKLAVSVTLWDAKGNTATKSFEVARGADPPPPSVDAGADAARDAALASADGG
jgi:hypothetical protein